MQLWTRLFSTSNKDIGLIDLRNNVVHNGWDAFNYKEIFEFYKKDISSEDKKRKEVQKMLEMITSFIVGAIGEEKVIDTLRKLPDSYYVLNEIQIKLSRSVLWKKYLEYIKTAQIDHVVIGPSGIFLIETKNWDEMNITSVHNSPHKQIERAGTNFRLKN